MSGVLAVGRYSGFISRLPFLMFDGVSGFWLLVSGRLPRLSSFVTLLRFLFVLHCVFCHLFLPVVSGFHSVELLLLCFPLQGSAPNWNRFEQTVPFAKYVSLWKPQHCCVKLHSFVLHCASLSVWGIQ